MIKQLVLLLSLTVGFYGTSISQTGAETDLALATRFMEALKSNDVKQVLNLMPGPDKIRLLLPLEKQSLSDKVIMEEIMLDKRLMEI